MKNKTNIITFKEIRSKARGNPFLIVENGRFPNPWLSPADLQAILDNEEAVREFIGRHASPPRAVAAPLPPPAPVIAQEPEPEAQEPIAPPTTPRPVRPAPVKTVVPVNDRVAALVNRAIGKDATNCPPRTTPRRFSSLT